MLWYNNNNVETEENNIQCGYSLFIIVIIYQQDERCIIFVRDGLIELVNSINVSDFLFFFEFRLFLCRKKIYT